jgi:heat shock protein HslJ
MMVKKECEKMKDLLVALVLIAAAVFMSACGSGNIIPPPQGEGVELALEGTKWALTEMNGEALIPNTQVTLSFNENVLGGNAGCNSYGGEYVAGPGGALQIEDVFRTLMACLEPVGLMEQEDEYLSALERADSYVLDNDTLIIMDAAGASILVFVRA